MNTSIGHTFLYNFIILFIVIVFAFLGASLSYYKAFKVNNKIIHAIEKYEGYNSLSKIEMDNSLMTLGYREGDAKCPSEYDGMTLVTLKDTKYEYCIYISETKIKKGTYYRYGVLTYMNIDLPIIDKLKLRVFTKTNRIYKFTNN